jgi:large subunit ribosomal protein L6
MSKIGKQTITIPEKVTVTVTDGGIYGNQQISVSGPQGEMKLDTREGVKVAVADNLITVTRENDTNQVKAYHGLFRSLLANMVAGVVTPYEKKLEIHGVGYRGMQKGESIELSLGFSHKVVYKAPEGIHLKMVDDTNVLISGIDKQMVGQVAAEIRQLRKPEPYKGKGIRYLGEQIRRKAGKTAASK